MSENFIGSISDFLPRHYSRAAYFEIHCHARISPSIPAKPVTLVMGQGVVELQKVILSQEKITEIDWVCLDRKLDFQFSLSAQELGRTDVKPYTTFIKKISIRYVTFQCYECILPNIFLISSPMTLQMTYENVPGFLEVDYIYHKQTTKYRIHFPFIVEITRVEKIPLKPQKTANYGAEKILGMTGKGQVWYEMQVRWILWSAEYTWFSYMLPRKKKRFITICTRSSLSPIWTLMWARRLTGKSNRYSELRISLVNLKHLLATLDAFCYLSKNANPFESSSNLLNRCNYLNLACFVKVIQMKFFCWLIISFDTLALEVSQQAGLIRCCFVQSCLDASDIVYQLRNTLPHHF